MSVNIDQNSKFDVTIPAGGNFRLSIEQDQELITNLVDRDFSGAGNWTGTGWTVSGGTFQHTTTSNIANAELLATYTGGIFRGQRYKVTFTISSFAAGTLTPAIGNSVGKPVAANGTYTQIIQANCTDCSLLFIPSGFNGYLDNVSLKVVIDAVGVDSTGALVTTGYYPAVTQKTGTASGWMGKVSTGLYPLQPAHGTLAFDGLDSDTLKVYDQQYKCWWPNSKFGGNPQLTRGLLCCFNMEENAANTTVADATSRCSGTSSVNTSTLHATGSGVTNLGDYFDFRGGANNDYVQINNLEATAGQYIRVGLPWSFSFWINQDSIVSYAMMLGRITGAGATPQIYVVNNDTTGKLDIEMVKAVGNQRTMFGNTVMTTGNWYHCAITYNGALGVAYNTGDLKMYVNNTLQSLSARIDGGSIDATVSNSTWHIGCDPLATSQDIDGKMDQICIWNRELTPAEVSLLYNSGNGLAF